MASSGLKTLPLGPEPPGITRFMAASVAIHVVFALIVFALGREYAFGDRRGSPEAVPVEVVELPPDYAVPSSEAKPPKRPMRYADRTSVVEKESFPAARPGRYMPARPKAGARSAAPSKPADAPPSAAGQADRAAKSAAKPAAVKATQAPSAAALPDPEGVARSAAAPAAPSAQPAVDGAKGSAGQPTTAAKAEPQRPNLALPEERIAELTKQYEAAAPANEKGKTLQLNTSELRYQKYVIGLKNRIEARWEYPEAAARRGWTGVLQIEFSILKDGTLAEARLVKSSGYPALDDAALTAIRLAAPFHPFPRELDIEQINIKGQFEYQIIYQEPR